MDQKNEPEVKAKYGPLGKWWIRVLRQQLWGFTPHFSEMYIVVVYLFIGLILVALGAVLLTESRGVKEQRIRYDDKGINASHVLEFNVTENWDSKIYVYFEITNYYQNHKRYVRSVDWTQLHGDDGEDEPGDEICQPIRWKTGPENTTDPRPDKRNTTFVRPCGLLPWSFVHDKFEIQYQAQGTGNLMPVGLNETNISWEVDRTELYGANVTAKNYRSIDGGELEGAIRDNEHFLVWMRVDARPTIRKLYGHLNNQQFQAGDKVSVTVTNNYDTSDFGGKKYVILSTLSFMGGRNNVLGITYIVVGSLGILAALVILALKYKMKRGLQDQQLAAMLSGHAQIESRVDSQVPLTTRPDLHSQ